MPSHVSLLMQMVTDPEDLTVAQPHSGGWSEGTWVDFNITSSDVRIRQWATKRAVLLPLEAAIIGFRIARYTISGNKLLPAGTATGKFLYPGNSRYRTDLPQVGLEFSAKTANGPNTSRFVLRCIPDQFMVRGEYQPDAAFKRAVTEFTNGHASGFENSFGFIGRDLSLASARVLSIQGGVVQLDGPIGAVGGTDWMRLNRVYDIDGKPVKGTFRIESIAAGNLYTVTGLAGVSANASGTARVDKVKYFDYSEVVPTRAVVKKVGRPFEAYRGRGSKR
jgi:hypothetical protein